MTPNVGQDRLGQRDSRTALTLTCRRRHSVHAIGVLLLRTTGAAEWWPSGVCGDLLTEDLVRDKCGVGHTNDSRALEDPLAAMPLGGLGVARERSLCLVGLIAGEGQRAAEARGGRRKKWGLGGPSGRGAFIVLGTLFEHR